MSESIPTISDITATDHLMDGMTIEQPVALQQSFPPEMFLAQELHAVPEEIHAECESVPMPQELPLLACHATEDPFMGWASKRASSLLDEYGWVLSHVEAL